MMEVKCHEEGEFFLICTNVSYECGPGWDHELLGMKTE